MATCSYNNSLSVLGLVLLVGCAPDSAVDGNYQPNGAAYDGTDLAGAEYLPDAASAERTSSDPKATVQVQADVYNGMAEPVARGVLCAGPTCQEILQGHAIVAAPAADSVFMHASAPGLVPTTWEVNTTNLRRPVALSMPDWSQMSLFTDIFGVDRQEGTAMLSVRVISSDGADIYLGNGEGDGPYYLDKDGRPLPGAEKPPVGQSYALFFNVPAGRNVLLGGTQERPCVNGDNTHPIEARGVMLRSDSLLVPRAFICQ